MLIAVLILLAAASGAAAQESSVAEEFLRFLPEGYYEEITFRDFGELGKLEKAYGAAEPFPSLQRRAAPLPELFEDDTQYKMVVQIRKIPLGELDSFAWNQFTQQHGDDVFARFRWLYLFEIPGAQMLFADAYTAGAIGKSNQTFFKEPVYQTTHLQGINSGYVEMEYYFLCMPTGEVIAAESLDMIKLMVDTRLGLHPAMIEQKGCEEVAAAVKGLETYWKLYFTQIQLAISNSKFESLGNLPPETIRELKRNAEKFPLLSVDTILIDEHLVSREIWYYESAEKAEEQVPEAFQENFSIPWAPPEMRDYNAALQQQGKVTRGGCNLIRDTVYDEELIAKQLKSEKALEEMYSKKDR